jgi:hypothetical protein
VLAATVVNKLVVKSGAGRRLTQNLQTCSFFIKIVTKTKPSTFSQHDCSLLSDFYQLAKVETFAVWADSIVFVWWWQ